MLLLIILCFDAIHWKSCVILFLCVCCFVVGLILMWSMVSCLILLLIFPRNMFLLVLAYFNVRLFLVYNAQAVFVDFAGIVVMLVVDSFCVPWFLVPFYHPCFRFFSLCWILFFNCFHFSAISWNSFIIAMCCLRESVHAVVFFVSVTAVWFWSICFSWHWCFLI